jgi:hypothetical protein
MWRRCPWTALAGVLLLGAVIAAAVWSGSALLYGRALESKSAERDELFEVWHRARASFEVEREEGRELAEDHAGRGAEWQALAEALRETENLELLSPEATFQYSEDELEGVEMQIGSLRWILAQYDEGGSALRDAVKGLRAVAG